MSTISYHNCNNLILEGFFQGLALKLSLSQLKLLTNTNFLNEENLSA